MSNLLLLLLLLACPLMMIFMMRGMHGGRDRSDTGHDAQADHHEVHSPDGQPPDARVAQLEREVASLRAVQGGPPEPRRGDRP